MTTLTATTLARNLSEYLNQVRYQGATFDIQRGSDVVACLTPVSRMAAGYPVARLGELLAGLPRLDDAEAMLRDIHEVTEVMPTETDAWGS